MPEVRLAWRAVRCHGSSRSQVYVGVAPGSEQEAVCAAPPRPAVRCYQLGQTPAGGTPCRGFGAGPDVFGVLPLTSPDGEWDAVLTISLTDPGALRRLGAREQHPAWGDALFVAAIGLTPPAERRLFERLSTDGRAEHAAELRRQVASLCAVLDKEG